MRPYGLTTLRGKIAHNYVTFSRYWEKMELFIEPNSHDTQRVAEPDVLGHFRVKYP